MRNCSICKKEEPNGILNVKQKYVCRVCAGSYPNLYSDDFIYEKGKVVQLDPLLGQTDDQQREIFIQWKMVVVHIYSVVMPKITA